MLIYTDTDAVAGINDINRISDNRSRLGCSFGIQAR
jgi:hypothetical protein